MKWSFFYALINSTDELLVMHDTDQTGHPVDRIAVFLDLAEARRVARLRGYQVIQLLPIGLEESEPRPAADLPQTVTPDEFSRLNETPPLHLHLPDMSLWDASPAVQHFFSRKLKIPRRRKRCKKQQ